MRLNLFLNFYIIKWAFEWRTIPFFSTFLSKNAFCLAGLRRLVVLDLSSNHISRLDEGLLDDLTALQVLHLGNNQIHTIATQSFINLANLHSLYLMHNRLETLQRQTLTGLSLLSILNLDNNRYKMLIHQHLKPLTWLLKILIFLCLSLGFTPYIAVLWRIAQI